MPRAWRALATLALLAALSSACGDGGPGARGEGDEGEPLPWDQGGEDVPEYSLGRLLVSDARGAHITVFDLDSESIAGTLDAAPGTRVYAGASGRYGYAYDAEASLFRVLDPGQWLLSHIDHFHVAKSELGLRDEQIALAGVGTFTSHEGWVAVSDPGRGRVVAFQERSITAMSFAPVTIVTPPHAGVAIVSHAHVFMSEPADDGAWGIGVRSVTQPSVRARHVPACSAPTDIAGAGDHVYVACAEGLLSLRWRGADASALEIQRTRGATSAQPARLVRSHPELGAVLYDRDARTLVMAADGDPPRELALEDEILDVQIRRQGTAALALTGDGFLREVTLPALEAGRAVQVTAPIADLERAPRFVLSHAYAYVADAREPEVRAVRLRDMELERMLSIGGEPFDLALAGVPATYTDARE